MTHNPSNGDWPRVYERDADGLGLGREDWRAGWDRGARCPPDPKADNTPGMRGWRELGVVEGDRSWRELHGKRRQAVRLLRRAGYVARYRWSREEIGVRQVGEHLLPDVRYSCGPADGLQAVDPWEEADKLSGCGSSWFSQLRSTSTGPAILPLPRLCGRGHICPVCASVGARGRTRALAEVAGADVAAGRGQVALLTLTQRAAAGESLAAALDRFRCAWQRMTRGRPGRRFKALVPGWYMGLEVTRGAGAGPTVQGPHWHLHAHVLILLDTDCLEEARRVLAKMWESSSEAAAAAAGLPGYGWDPVAGVTKACSRRIEADADGTHQTNHPEWLHGPDGALAQGWPCQERNGWECWQEPSHRVQARIAAGDYSGPWLQVLPDDDADELRRHAYQAAKYATKTAELHPVPLAEFLAAAHGRRWHQGGGLWRSVRSRADDLAALLTDDAGDEERIDLGVGVVYTGHRDVPAVEKSIGAAGWMKQTTPPTTTPGPDGWEHARTAAAATWEREPERPPSRDADRLWFRLTQSDEAWNLAALAVEEGWGRYVDGWVRRKVPFRCIDAGGVVVGRRLVEILEFRHGLWIDPMHVHRLTVATLAGLRRGQGSGAEVPPAAEGNRHRQQQRDGRQQ